jgi:hypothetical protein
VFEGRSWCCYALAPAAVVSAFIVFGAIGHAHAQDNRRIFGVLDPVVDFIRIDGGRFVGWLFEHAVVVGVIVFGATVFVGLAGIVSTRKLSTPLLLACAGVGFVGIMSGLLSKGITSSATGLAALLKHVSLFKSQRQWEP